MSCAFPDASMTAAGAPHLARLTEVELVEVTISDESVTALVSQCKALERLEMMGMGNFGCVCVRSPSLKVLNCDGHFDELVIEYAPSLERLHGRYMYMNNWQAKAKGVHLKIEHAPKLAFMGYLSMSLHAIEIGQSVFTKDQINVKTLMPSLKTLAIVVCYVRSHTWSAIQTASQESWDVLSNVPCVDNHLQKVVFEVYRGHKWQREMAKFLHGKSMFLKAMEFHCKMDTNIPGDPFKVPSEEWVRKQQEFLSLDSRTSKDARFLFFKSQLVCNHHDVAHEGRYKRKYYDGLYDV